MFKSKEEQFDFYWKEIFTGLAYNPIEFNTYRFDQTMSLPGKVNKLYELFKVLAMNNQEVMDYLKAFVETFDEKLYGTVDDVLNEWLENDKLAKFIRDLINEEVIKARTDYLGKKYVNLKERLDSEKKDIVEVTAQLAQKANLNDFKKEMALRTKSILGKISLPNDFPAVGFNLYREKDGIKTNYNFERYKNHVVTLYVSDEGSNSVGNGTVENPYRTVAKALAHVKQASEPSFTILVDNEIILRREFSSEEMREDLSGKEVAIINNSNKKHIHVPYAENSGRDYINVNGDPFSALIWTNHSGNCYKTTRSATAYVVDLSYKDTFNNTIIKMIKAKTLSECETTPNSYYVSGSDVYVHTVNGRKPDSQVQVVLNVPSFRFMLQNGAKLYVEGFYFHSRNGLDIRGDLTGLSHSEFIMNNCNVGLTLQDNGLNINDVKRTVSFDSVIHDSFRDCFNYHYQNTPSALVGEILVIEVRGVGFNAGIDRIDVENNNATTMHEGGNILRVECIGYNTRGTPCADINGSYSVLYDCNMSESIATANPKMNNAYYFYTDIDTSGKGARVYMENCSGQGENSVVMTDSGTKLTLRNYHEGLDSLDLKGDLIID